MGNGFIGDETGDFHAEETAAPSGVAENLAAIGGGDERGQARLGDVSQALATVHGYGQHL